MNEADLKAIIVCGQSDGYLIKWAKEQLEKDATKTQDPIKGQDPYQAD